jgi:hypothetical protein
MDWEDTKPSGAPKAPDVWSGGSINSGTNLGLFNNLDVGINPGDQFRVLDEFGDLVEEAELSSILNGFQIKLAPPGLTAFEDLNDYIGMRFEIYLRQAPVPHEQSNEQLLDLITNSVVTRTFADYDNDLGGYVPEIGVGEVFGDAANQLFDDLNADGTGGQSFAALGVRKNDIVLIDPAGKVPQVGGLPVAQERGARPVGDEGIVDRVTDFTAGSPSLFDDNRGFYRVRSVEDTGVAPHLVVSGVSTFAGEVTAPTVFPEDTTARATYGYTIYPTVNGSSLNRFPFVDPDPGAGNYVEGQMDLRPTQVRDAVTKSFAGAPYSIRPFSYTVIRPSGLFTDEAIDLVLTVRERMLSLIELFRSSLTGRRSGTYFIFQRDQHLQELTDPVDPTIGLGVFANIQLQTIIGRVDVAPFTNTSDALSLLDRRFWVLDRRLDGLTPKGDGVSMAQFTGTPEVPYTAYTDEAGSSVLPVLPDRVNLVLNQTDRFRDLRFVWLAYRTHRILGTLAAITRFDAELPERVEEQKRGLLLQAGFGEVEI